MNDGHFNPDKGQLPENFLKRERLSLGGFNLKTLRNIYHNPNSIKVRRCSDSVTSSRRKRHEIVLSQRSLCHGEQFESTS
jgi:hypothetical protein